MYIFLWNIEISISILPSPSKSALHKEVVLSNSSDFYPQGFQMKEEHIFQPPADNVCQLFFWIQSTSKVFRRLLITKIAYSLKYDRLLPQFQSIAIFIYFIPMITTKLQFLGICFWLIGLEKQNSSLYNQTTVYGVK